MMDITNFGFYMESIPWDSWNNQMALDFALKCYNLFLLYFYFNVMKFAVTTFQRIVRRMSKFTNGRF